MTFGGPLNVFGHLLFSAHMLQQSILYLAMPPLILAGLPEGFYNNIMAIPVLRSVLRLLTKRLVRLEKGWLYLYEWPVVDPCVCVYYFLAIHPLPIVYTRLTYSLYAFLLHSSGHTTLSFMQVFLELPFFNGIEQNEMKIRFRI